MPTQREEDQEVRSKKLMAHYKRIFARCDLDGDNLICVGELDAFIHSKNCPVRLPKHVVKHIHSVADKDGDKKLHFDEFVELIEHPDLEHLFAQWIHSYINFLVPRPKPVPRPAEEEKEVETLALPQVVQPEQLGDVRPPTRMARAVPMRKVPVAEPFAKEEDLLIKKPIVVEDLEELYYIDAFKCCPPPIAMFLISLIELTFFLVDEITLKNSTLSGSGITALIFIYDPFKRHEIWRYLTYMFVHIGYFHIIVNLAVQLLLGIPLEMVHKWWRVLLVYFAGVIAGSLATSITDPWMRLAGASGGVYALLTAHIATIIMNWREMTFPGIQLFIFGLISSSDIGSSVYDRFFRNTNDQIGIAAHFGGAVAGLLVGIYILKNLNVTTFEKYVWWIALVLYILLMGTAIVLNIFWKDHFPS